MRAGAGLRARLNVHRHDDMNPFGAEFAACTIIARNYLPWARVLCESWHRFHPQSPFFVLFLDSPSGFFSPDAEAFQSVFVEDLEIPHIDSLMFKYFLVEASTAVKPHLLEHLLRRYSPKKLVYLDGDILIVASLDKLATALEYSSILLTPHLLAPVPRDNQHEDDHDILKTGVYNLGFLGLRNDLESHRLLEWWSGKLYHHCIDDRPANLFVDQRWMDLVPGLFTGVEILQDPGYNVARWNLHERAVCARDGFTVNGGPLYFFHFSGFDPDRPWLVSKYEYRYAVDEIGGARELYMQYRDLLIQRGWNETRNWPYGRGFFSNGVKIPASARRYYWGLGPDVSWMGNPFAWLGTGLRNGESAAAVLAGSTNSKRGINLVADSPGNRELEDDAGSIVRLLRAAGVPYDDSNSPADENSHGKNAIDKDFFLANLLLVSPKAIPWFAKENPSLKEHFIVGYWSPQVPEFPHEWAAAFGYVDEVWAPSEFTRSVIAAASPVPVRVVPLSIDPIADASAQKDQAGLALNPETFSFLCVLDSQFPLERQNSLGLIQAYKNAFGTRPDVQLVIVRPPNLRFQDELARLHQAAHDANVRIIDAVLSRQGRRQLIMSANCYVSLHRVEAFGLTLAEAMFCGKPVLATAYSGNVDYMSDDDSFLVPYRMTVIGRTLGIYKAGYRWADPDLDCAADLMRHIESNRAAASEAGARAAAKIRRLLDAATIGASARMRLEELGVLEKTLGDDVRVTGSD